MAVDEEDGAGGDLGKEKGENVNEGHLTRQKPRWRSVMETCCGLSGVKSAELTAEEMSAQIKRLTSIREKRRTRILLDINAVVLLAVAVFLIAFYH